MEHPNQMLILGQQRVFSHALDRPTYRNPISMKDCAFKVLTDRTYEYWQRIFGRSSVAELAQIITAVFIGLFYILAFPVYLFGAIYYATRAETGTSVTGPKAIN